MKSEQIDLRVANLDCDSEAEAITRGLRGEPGIVDVRVWPKAARLHVTYDAETTNREAIEGRLQAMGFAPQEGRPAGPLPPWRNPKVLASVASGLLLLMGCNPPVFMNKLIGIKPIAQGMQPMPFVGYPNAAFIGMNYL